MSTLSRAGINRCRMRFLGATLYQLSGSANRSEYARFCDRLYRPGFYSGLGTEDIKAVPLNRKWFKLLDHGVQLKEQGLHRLTQALPELIAVLDNPLWQVLSWDSQDQQGVTSYLNAMRPHCTALVGSTYRLRTNARMKWALGVPDWRRLSLPLALLGSVGHPSQRRWLSEHFCNYLVLASFSPVYQGCFSDLWLLINQWLAFREGVWNKPETFSWAPDLAAFEIRRYVFEEGRDVMMEHGWLLQSDSMSNTDIAMLWCIYLGGKPLMERLLKSLAHGVHRCPRLLRHLMRELDPRLDVRVTSRPLTTYKGVAGARRVPTS